MEERLIFLSQGFIFAEIVFGGFVILGAIAYTAKLHRKLYGDPEPRPRKRRPMATRIDGGKA